MTQDRDFSAASPERVSATLRLASVVTFLGFLAIAFTSHHRLSEVGLAFITGSAMFVTPELISALVATNTWASYIKTVSLLAMIVVPVTVVTEASTLGLWKTLVLASTATLEFILLLGGVPWYVANVAKLVTPERVKQRVAGWRSRCAPLAHIEQFDDDRGFLRLGAGLFLFGTTLQFIAGS